MKELIRKILRESENDFNWSESNEINHFNWEENAENFGGHKNMIKDLYDNDPMNFLLSLPKMEVVQSTENPDYILFRYEPKKNLMVYDKKNKKVYINYYEIWSVLQDFFGLNYTETQQLTKRWVDEVYNLRGITTTLGSTRTYL